MIPGKLRPQVFEQLIEKLVEVEDLPAKVQVIDKPVEAAKAQLELPAVRGTNNWMRFIIYLLVISVIAFALLLRNYQHLREQNAQISQEN